MPGSSDPIDGAVDTLLAGAGVCRDFAHLVVALLRAVNVPARVVSVYAPGLYPMDFHAVAEAFVEGQWRVVDGTLLAPRQALVRIATGRDAADIAFLDNHKGAITLNKLVVTAAGLHPARITVAQRLHRVVQQPGPRRVPQHQHLLVTDPRRNRHHRLEARIQPPPALLPGLPKARPATLPPAPTDNRLSLSVDH